MSNKETVSKLFKDQIDLSLFGEYITNRKSSVDNKQQYRIALSAFLNSIPFDFDLEEPEVREALDTYFSLREKYNSIHRQQH